MAFVSFKRYKVDPANVDEIMRRAQAGFVPRIRQAPGFIAYRVMDAGDGVIASITIFEEEAQADEFNTSATGWFKENLAEFFDSPAEVTAGKVVISEQA